MNGNKHKQSEPLRGAESQPHEIDASGRKRRHPRRWCCLSCGVITVAIVVTITVLLVLLIKAKAPQITVTSTSVEGVQTRFDAYNMKMYLNLTMKMGMAVKNPNKIASFKHGNSTTVILYRGDTVGEAVMPAGKIKADKTVNMNVTVTVYVDQLVNSGSNLLTDGIGGSLNVTTRTKIGGRARLVGIIKKHISARVECGIALNVTSGTAQTQSCSKKIKF